MNRVKFIEAIRKLDPDGKVVLIDAAKSQIQYSSEITMGRHISVLADEELVRAYYVVKFVMFLGYDIHDIILEKEYSAGGRSTVKPRIDIILKDRRGHRDKTYLFMETKAPGTFDTDKELIKNELFELGKLEDKTSPISYLCYCTADIEDDKIIEKNIIIDYTKYIDYNKWIEDGKLALDIFQRDYGIPRKTKYVKNEKDLRTNVTKAEFDCLRKDLHNVLWGGGETAYNEIFVGLVKIFLAKIYDENSTKNKKPYAFQIEYVGNTAQSAEEIYVKINHLYKSGLRTYLYYSKEQVEEEALNKRAISPQKVRYVVEQLQSISLTKNKNSESDLLGDFFEKIVTEGFKQDKGQFFTHQNIVKFIIYALGIDDCAVEKVNSEAGSGLPYICDPSCGSGTFLISVMRIVTDTLLNRRKDEVEESELVKTFLGANLPIQKPNAWAGEYLYGIEINADLALATKVNMVLHGDGSSNIYCKNAMTPFNTFTNNEKINLLSNNNIKSDNIYEKPVNEQFDFIITNPPFSIKMDNETKEKLPQSFTNAEKGNIENLFIERYYQLLRDGGKAGIVLPESVFDTGENQNIRQFIYKYFKITAIVSLGGGKDGAFLPYTPTKTSLLFLEKKSLREVNAYDALWRENANLYAKLRRKAEKMMKGPTDSQQNREVLNEFLEGYPEYTYDLNKTVQEVLTQYSEELQEIMDASEWWIFNRVSQQLDYKIFIAHTVELGYHRTKNREFKRKNKLYAVNEQGEVVIDYENPHTILDYMKSHQDSNLPDMFYLDFHDIAKSITLRCDFNFHTYKKFEEPYILSSFSSYTFLHDYIVNIRNGKDIARKFYSEDASGNVIETKYKYLTTSNYTQNGIDTDRLLPEFLEYYLNSVIMKRYFEVFGVGKTQKNIAQGDIRRIIIPVIPIMQQEKIVHQLKEKSKYTEANIQKHYQEIEALRLEWNRVVMESVVQKDKKLDFLL